MYTLQSLFPTLEVVPAHCNHAAYPPYNLEKVDQDTYRLTMNVAGFSDKNLEITLQNSTLTIKGKKPPQEGKNYLYRGIAENSFVRKFRLAEHTQISYAKLVNGILTVEVSRELPDHMKPRQIYIQKHNHTAQAA